MQCHNSMACRINTISYLKCISKGFFLSSKYMSIAVFLRENREWGGWLYFYDRVILHTNTIITINNIPRFYLTHFLSSSILGMRSLGPGTSEREISSARGHYRNGWTTSPPRSTAGQHLYCKFNSGRKTISRHKISPPNWSLPKKKRSEITAYKKQLRLISQLLRNICFSLLYSVQALTKHFTTLQS